MANLKANPMIRSRLTKVDEFWADYLERFAAYSQNHISTVSLKKEGKIYLF